MPNTDIRVQVTFPGHWKTRKMERLAGDMGVKCLIYLWIFVAVNKPDGELAGMSDNDIEDAAYWTGPPGQFIKSLLECGFIDGEETTRAVHDWQEHNKWCAEFPIRSERNRKNIVKRWDDVEYQSNTKAKKSNTGCSTTSKVRKGKGRKGEGNLAVAKWTDLMRENLDTTYKPSGADCAGCKEAFEHVEGDIDEFARRALNCINDEWFREHRPTAKYFANNIEKFKIGLDEDGHPPGFWESAGG